MPIYIYRCRQCGQKSEMLRGINEKDTELTCPKCGAKELEKLIMPFFGGVPRSPGGGFSFG